LAASHAACDILGLDVFDEDDLYENLEWLCDNQVRTEDVKGGAKVQRLAGRSKTVTLP
jgi:hypothetical protein